MIDKMSASIAKWLLHSGAISQDDQELFKYATYSLLFNLIPIGLVLVIGGLLGMMMEGIFLILPFMLIRNFSGGFHLKSPGICFISSVSLLTAFLLGIRYILNYDFAAQMLPLVILATIQIFVSSPIDSEARQLTEKERIVFRKIARILVCSVFGLYAILWLIGSQHIAVPVGSGIVLTALLQIPCFFLSSKYMRNQKKS